MSLADAFQFTRELHKLETLKDCTALFRRTVDPFGIDAFACGELDLANRARNAFYIIDWPDAWTKFYLDSGMIERDPLVDELATRIDPFTWTDLRHSLKLKKAGRAALDLAAVNGWSDGLVVPVPRGHSRVGLVSLVGRDSSFDSATVALLSLMCLSLHSHVRSLVSRENFALAPAGLTRREIECLILVARGFSDGAIGKNLGIAISTAHEHVENAKRKLQVRSRMQLVAIAAALGIIDI